MTQRRPRRTSALNSTMTDRVADVLRGMVLDGTLRPGQRLPIRDVSRALDVSVMPVREALIRLESLGLVKQFPHRGAIVATLTIDELDDLYTAREVVEPPVLQRGTAMLSTDDVADLGQIADELDDAVDRHDVAEVLRLDEMFLSVVYDATGNAALLKIISDFVEPSVAVQAPVLRGRTSRCLRVHRRRQPPAAGAARRPERRRGSRLPARHIAQRPSPAGRLPRHSSRRWTGPHAGPPAGRADPSVPAPHRVGRPSPKGPPP